jgi:hypothetical protein
MHTHQTNMTKLPSYLPNAPVPLAQVAYDESKVPFAAPGWNEPHPELPTAEFYDEFYNQ